MNKDSAELWAKVLITQTASMAMLVRIAKHRSDLVTELSRHPTIQEEINESILDCDIILNRGIENAK